MASITAFLFAEYRRQVLSLLLLHPETRYHVREIARLTHTTAGTLHRELSKLAKANVLIREENGNQVLYQANIAFAFFEELASILRKTSGIPDVLSEALAPLANKIDAAFIFGSVARGTETSESDIDVLIIGDISFTDAVRAMYPSQTLLKREINPKVYSKSEWNKLVKEESSFVKELLNAPKLFIIGTLDDLK